ncbi:MAG: SGNH/GDSL hydrolase family protein [Victivallales bacterium]|nr:SGNH/GDSL hydrolase family protein [Victivallales bacterium]
MTCTLPLAVATLALAYSAMAATETKVVLRESYEKYHAGESLRGTRGAGKGASIAVSADHAAGGKHALRFVDAPGLEKSYNPHREIRLTGRKIIRTGKVSLSFDVRNHPERPAAFHVEMRDWTKGAYKALPELLFGADGSLTLNRRATAAKLAPGTWYHVEVDFLIGPEAKEKTYAVALTAAGKAAVHLQGTYAKNAQAITWLGVVTQNEKHAEFTMDNLELKNERDVVPEPPHQLYTDYVMRGNLMRSYGRFASGTPARVAFMGGSVTTRQWRQPLMEALEERFPDTRFDFIMAGIGGTNADLGAFRLPEHVLGRGKVDLFFLEFAVNGGGVRAMEGIVRQARQANPEVDIVILYFANTGHTKSFNDGKIPGIVQQHEKVATQYGVPALYLYREIARRIKEGKIKWEDFASDAVHPHQGGCDMYTQCIQDFLDTCWQDKALAPIPATPLPERLDPICYEKGRFIPLEKADVKQGFKRERKWTVKPTCNFSPPVDVLACTEPGSELSLEFEGRAIGIYTIIGMDAGVIEYAIDDQPFQKADQFDHYCPRFHRPQHKIFADDLEPGTHTIIIRSAAGKNPKSEGHAIRIMKFMAN